MTEPLQNHPGLLRAAELAEEAAATVQAGFCRERRNEAFESGMHITAERFDRAAECWDAAAAANRARAEQYRGLVRAVVEQHKETNDA